MQTSTHSAIGLAVGVGVAMWYGTDLPGVLLTAALGGIVATLPDTLEFNILPHRKPTHSLFTWAVVHALAVTFIPVTFIAQTVSSAYLSHIIADAATIWGVWWLYPFPYRLWILPKRERIITGSKLDELFGVVMLCLTAAAFFKYAGF